MISQIKPFCYYTLGLILLPIIWLFLIVHAGTNMGGGNVIAGYILGYAHLLFFVSPLFICLLLKENIHRGIVFILWMIACAAFPVITYILVNFAAISDKSLTSLTRFITAGSLTIICFFILLLFVLSVFLAKKLSLRKTYASLFILFAWGGFFPINLTMFSHMIFMRITGYNFMTGEAFMSIWLTIANMIVSAVFFLGMGLFIILRGTHSPKDIGQSTP